MRGKPARRTDDHRHADGLLVRAAFVDEPVFAEIEAVVAGIDNDRVIGFAVVIEPLDDPADAVVHCRHRAVVVALNGQQVGIRVVVGKFDAVEAVALVAHPQGASGIVPVQFGAVGQGEYRIRVLVAVALGRREVGMYRLV